MCNNEYIHRAEIHLIHALIHYGLHLLPEIFLLFSSAALQLAFSTSTLLFSMHDFLILILITFSQFATYSSNPGTTRYAITATLTPLAVGLYTFGCTKAL
jgi:hypothetical protein